MTFRSKACIDCGEELPATSDYFYAHKMMRDGLLNRCKRCHNKKSAERHAGVREKEIERRREKYRANKDAVLSEQREYYRRNKEAIVDRVKRYRESNPELIKERKRLYRLRNLEKVRAKNRLYNEERKSRGLPSWRKQNPERAREYHRSYCRNWLSSGKRRACHTIAVMMARSLRTGKSGWSWEKLVGYTREDLIRHLERQFLPGMTWENYGEWHVDHILPIASFNFESVEDSDFKACWAITNLRPFWGIANMSKGRRRLHLL